MQFSHVACRHLHDFRITHTATSPVLSVVTGALLRHLLMTKFRMAFPLLPQATTVSVLRVASSLQSFDRGVRAKSSRGFVPTLAHCVVPVRDVATVI